jgi:hypothetical protein
LFGSQWTLELRPVPVPTQGHARFLRWGSRRVFYFWSFLVLAIGPQRQTPLQRARGGGRERVCGRGKKYVLARSGRFSCAQSLGPRALFEVGLVAFFIVFGRFWSWPCDPSAKPRPVENERESVGEGKNCCSARSGRSSCAPSPGPRALSEVGLAAFFVVVGRILAIGPQRQTPPYRGHGHPRGPLTGGYGRHGLSHTSIEFDTPGVKAPNLVLNYRMCPLGQLQIPPYRGRERERGRGQKSLPGS